MWEKVGCIILTILNIVGLVAGGILAGSDNEIKQYVGTAITIVMGIRLIFVMLALAFSIVLVVGLHQNKPGHLKAYLIYSVIFIVLAMIDFIYTCATAYYTALSVILNLLAIIFAIYFTLVIRSMFYVMKNANGPAIYSA